MKNVILIIGFVLLLVHFLVGGMFSASPGLGMGCGVIVVNTILLYGVAAVRLKDGYKISLSCLFGLVALAEYVLSLFAPAIVKGNVCLAICLFLLVMEFIICVVAKYVSGKQQYKI